MADPVQTTWRPFSLVFSVSIPDGRIRDLRELLAQAPADSALACFMGDNCKDFEATPDELGALPDVFEARICPLARKPHGKGYSGTLTLLVPEDRDPGQHFTDAAAVLERHGFAIEGPAEAP